LNVSRHVAKPWGFEIWWAVTDSYAGKLIHVEQGHRLSIQYHQRKDESAYVMSGLVRLHTGPAADQLQSRDLGPGGCWRIRPGEVHGLEALETSVLLEVSTPQMDDVVRLFDDYGRAEGSGPEPATKPAERQTPRLLDREQLAGKLSLSRSEVSALTAQPGFPEPGGYFRGRLLWNESAVDAWLARPHEAGDIVQALRAG
jgi:quercetin dioxygenase-like cupin family protein/predicted DNA-binding transcriptional regulator AlpA